MLMITFYLPNSYRGSDMRAHVLNELRKRNKMLGYAEHFITVFQ